MTLSDKTFLEKIGVGTVTVLAYPFMFVIVSLIGVPLGLLDAWVINKLWFWFVLPQFNLPVPKLWMTYGLLLFWWHVSYQYSKDDRKFMERLVIRLTMLLFVWLTGAFVHWVVVR